MEEQVTFMFQVGLVRDQVSMDASQMTLKTLKDLACNFINQRVSVLCPKQLSNLKHICSFFILFYFYTDFVILSMFITTHLFPRTLQNLFSLVL